MFHKTIGMNLRKSPIVLIYTNFYTIKILCAAHQCITLHWPLKENKALKENSRLKVESEKLSTESCLCKSYTSIVLSHPIIT